MSCTLTPRRSFAIQPDGGGREMSDSPMKKLLCILAAVAFTPIGFLFAQTSDAAAPRGPRRGGPHGPGGPGGHPIVRALDTDKDGELSATELTTAPAGLKALDKNGDGSVTLDEVRPTRPAGVPTPPADSTLRRDDRTRPVDPVMLALDANKDGALSAAEMANATASLKALDANSDGKLTRDELRPLPPEKS